MKIGLTGDTHNNLKNIGQICSLFNKIKVDFVIHTGDITLPKSLEAFNKLNMPLKGVYGNNDQGEIEGLNKICSKYNFEFYDSFRLDVVLNRKIYTVHDPLDIQENFFERGNIILHGHTHRYRNEKFREAYLFNPGECAGMISGKNSIGIVTVCEPKLEIINF